MQPKYYPLGRLKTRLAGTVLARAIIFAAVLCFGAIGAGGQNKAILFDSGFYIDAPPAGSAGFDFTTDSFTIEAWIRPVSFGNASLSNNLTLFSKELGGSNGGGYVLRTGGDRRLSFRFSNGTGYKTTTTAGPVLVPDLWQHVAVSKAGNLVTLYVNGAVVKADTLSGNYNIAPGSAALRMGQTALGTNLPFNGLMDEVKIWDTVRSQAAITNDQAPICALPYPGALLAYYRLDDTGSAAANPIVCANDPALNGITAGPIQSQEGAFGLLPTNTVLYVDSTSSLVTCGPQGLSWSTAYPDLSAALYAAQANPQIERIYIAKGTYYPRHYRFDMLGNGAGTESYSIAGNEHKVFHLRAGLEVYGGYPSGGSAMPDPGTFRVILDGSRGNGMAGDTVNNVVYVDHPLAWPSVDTTVLEGVTVMNGKATLYGLGEGFGGGIIIATGPCRVERCVVKNNRCLNGGAGILNGGIAYILNDTIVENKRLGMNSSASGLSSAGSLYASGNYVAYNELHGIQCHGGYNYISNNVSCYNLSGGIVQSEAHSFITGNQVHHNGASGIYIHQPDTCMIADNDITDQHVEGDYGGGVYLYGGHSLVAYNRILRDTAIHGGGIYCYNGFVDIHDNVIEGNVASSQGGGIHYTGYGNCTVHANIIRNNMADNSGGAFLNGGNMRLTSNVLTGNSATSFIGAAGVYGNFTVANNLVAYNAASLYSAMNCTGPTNQTGYVVNNTFYANSEAVTDPHYGALNVEYGNVEVSNNILWKNTTGGTDTFQGADYTSGYATVLCRYNLFQLPEAAYTYTGNPGSDLGVNGANNFFGTDPLFANEASIPGPDGVLPGIDDGLILAYNSPVLDSGNAALLPPGITLDLKGSPRTLGTGTDLGAYELGCAPGNTTPAQAGTVCPGNTALLTVNTASPPASVQWYADSTSTAVLDTGYTFITPPLYAPQTFWVAVAGCADSSRIPVLISVGGGGNLSITQIGNTLTADTGGSAYQWYTCAPLQPVPGATSATFTATQNGDYTVMATVNGCADTAACVSVTGLSVADNDAGAGLHVYPNPCSNTATVSMPFQNHPAVLTITDIRGLVLREVAVPAGSVFTIDLSPYPSGIYHLLLSNKDQKWRAKIAKL